MPEKDPALWALLWSALPETVQAEGIAFAAGDLMSIKSVASATAGTKYYQATVEVQA